MLCYSLVERRRGMLDSPEELLLRQERGGEGRNNAPRDAMGEPHQCSVIRKIGSRRSFIAFSPPNPLPCPPMRTSYVAHCIHRAARATTQIQLTDRKNLIRNQLRLTIRIIPLQFLKTVLQSSPKK